METIAQAGIAVHSNPGEEVGFPSIGTTKPPLGIFVAADLSTIEGITDAGRRIPLFHYAASYILPPGVRLDTNNPAECKRAFRTSEQQFLSGSNQDSSKLFRTHEPDLGSNCHGWVFAAGRFGIKVEHVPGILADHGYFEVREPRDGDIAVYFENDEALHSALVKPASNGNILVEGKYGPFSVFRHAPQDFSFHGDYSFFRTSRTCHFLKLQQPKS